MPVPSKYLSLLHTVVHQPLERTCLSCISFIVVSFEEMKGKVVIFVKQKAL